MIKPEQIPYEAKMKLRAVLLDGETDEAVALAAEITRLKAEVERLRAALKMHACDCTFAAQCAVPTKCRNYLARAALAPSQERHLSLNEQAVMHSALRQSVTKEPRT